VCKTYIANNFPAIEIARTVCLNVLFVAGFFVKHGPCFPTFTVSKESHNLYSFIFSGGRICITVLAFSRLTNTVGILVDFLLSQIDRKNCTTSFLN
jgi:hypothetical protein